MPYEAVFSNMKHESDFLDDGTNINSSITSLKSYVVDISEDGNYNYLTVLEVVFTNSKGTSISKNILLTYSIDADGNVSNFHAATPKIDKK